MFRKVLGTEEQQKLQINITGKGKLVDIYLIG
jgi:hypothetical protein